MKEKDKIFIAEVKECLNLYFFFILEQRWQPNSEDKSWSHGQGHLDSYNVYQDGNISFLLK